MPRFSTTSAKRLGTCNNDLQRLFKEVVKHFDCKVLCGHRGQEKQDEAFNNGWSKLRYPNSKHNSYPSNAVDVAPYPLRWPDKIKDPKQRDLEWRRWYMFVGVVRGVASQMNIGIRCGADWDGDMEIKDQNFHDLPHFELKK